MRVVMRGAEEEGRTRRGRLTPILRTIMSAQPCVGRRACARTDARTHARQQHVTQRCGASNMAGKHSEEHEDEEWWEELPAELNKHNIHSSIPSLCICTVKFDTL